ncbi:AAA family ATPase [Sneathiella sp.]|jgi:aminoglycoside phosphotransferase family enzyme/predicted kinase|uniref:bifunctional aminoglycoside phosphotransferase/ATP-binding protein n=1 Tax=Sneathiella sp. TaxID=1964365 RepID=UPI0039E54943
MELLEQLEVQQKLIAFLIAHPNSWDPRAAATDPVEVIETHGATVLLGPTVALKIKKAVHFDHMNYSTLSQRKYFCDKEVAINQNGARGLYHGVIALYRSNEEFSLTPSQEIVEYAVKMQRFPKGSRLDERVQTGNFPVVIQDKLSDTLASFHLKAEIIDDSAKIPTFATVIEQNFHQLDHFCPELLSQDAVDDFRENLINDADRLSPLFQKRQQDGWIRAGHGDLHLQNICVLNDQPLLFDAIEYQDDFVISDVLYDVAFLIMDLWYRDQKMPANRIFNRYLGKIGWTTSVTPLEALQALPFFMSMRAGIRTHVAGNRYRQAAQPDQKAVLSEQTKSLFEAACAYQRSDRPSLIAIGGYSGSGKSTLAERLAPEIGTTAPGAIRLRSDVLRRQLIDWDDYSPMPQWAYTPQMSEKTYSLMARNARAILQAGHSVIVDAVLDRPTDQQQFKELAASLNVPFHGLWLSVNKDNMKDRINKRTRDASDATVDILDKQLAAQHEIPNSWSIIDGNGSIEKTTVLAREALP